MVHTNYSGTSIFLLGVGTLLCVLSAFVFVMTRAFGTNPVHDYSSFMIQFQLILALLSVPTFLLMFRWCQVGSVAIWWLTLSSGVLGLLSAFAGPTLFVLVLLLLKALICSGIYSISRKAGLTGPQTLETLDLR